MPPHVVAGAPRCNLRIALPLYSGGWGMFAYPTPKGFPMAVPQNVVFGDPIKFAHLPGPGALELARFAHEELGLLHFMACLANKQAPRPSELLKALGVARPDADYGKLMLAEHVPDAA